MWDIDAYLSEWFVHLFVFLVTYSFTYETLKLPCSKDIKMFYDGRINLDILIIWNDSNYLLAAHDSQKT